MEYKLSEQELKDLMHRTWLQSKKFYSGKTDEYFYDYFESEKKQFAISGFVRQSEQLFFCKHITTRNPKEHQENKCRFCGKPYQKN